jgi:hypothetical protein
MIYRKDSSEGNQTYELTLASRESSRHDVTRCHWQLHESAFIVAVLAVGTHLGTVQVLFNAGAAVQSQQS